MFRDYLVHESLVLEEKGGSRRRVCGEVGATCTDDSPCIAPEVNDPGKCFLFLYTRYIF